MASQERLDCSRGEPFLKLNREPFKKRRDKNIYTEEMSLSAESPRTQVTSSEHRWALHYIPTGRQFLGLTEREMNLIYEWMAKEAPSDWACWSLGWPDWRSLDMAEVTWNLYSPEFPTDLDQPPKRK